MLNKKSLICTFLFGLLCSFGVKAQVIDGAKVTRITFDRSTDYFTALSDNGLWATASGTDEENTTIGGFAQLVNTTTGERTNLWPDDGCYTAVDVTDDGKIVVGSANGKPAYYDVDSKTWVTLPGQGEPTRITPDGKRIVGFYFGEDDGTGYAQQQEIPVIWDRQADGSYAYNEAATLYPNFPNRDKNNLRTNMIRINNVSADGNILAGAMNFVYMGEGSYYVFNCETGETQYVENLYPQGLNNAGSYADACNMSNDGTHLTGQAYVVSTSGEYTAAFDMNIPGKSLNLYNQFSDEQDRGGFAVSNSGMVFASSPAVNPMRYLYVRHGNLWFGLDEIMSGRYGINLYESIGQEYSGYAIGVSNDEKVLLAMSAVTGDGYIVRLPETFTEAASHIDPFAEGTYTVSPTAGSSFVRYREGLITFSKPTTLAENATGRLVDSTGETFTTVNITALTNGTSFSLSGLALPLTPGEQYTLIIPAGTFSLSADNSYKNSEIRVTYTGRENSPVQVVAKAPDDGVGVSEISTSQPVRIQFDMDVKAGVNKDNTAKVGYLYEGDSETPLCELAITTNGPMAGFAPALRRYLRSGLDYRVVIPADAFTDFMGDCGNEEIVINYKGAFVPEPDEAGNLFFDDFNDPSTSMGTWLLYEGDHNTPAAEPAGWEFDADNNPWNFTTRDDENSTDYYATSHSMYNPAGTSDDWMAIPQLYIENADYYLNFNAQNYKANKNDVLKVVVLAADEGYTTFTKDLYDRFVAEGKTVFEQKLSYGESQANVSSDWTEGTNFEISLADFAGKNIYIAFVNQNTDQSAIFVDNVKVYYRGDFLLTDNTTGTVVKQSSAKILGQVNITGDNTYNDITATLTDGDGQVISTVTATGLGLTKDSPAYEFEFPEVLPLAEGEANAYTMTVTVDGNQLSRQGTVKNLTFETTKRIVLEEYTGESCVNCPLGIEASENLSTVFGDKFIPIEIHGPVAGPDRFSSNYTTAYQQYIGFTGAPEGIISRRGTIYAPTAQIVDPVSFESVRSFNGDENTTTWLDEAQAELTDYPYADADITVTTANVNTAARVIEIAGNVRYAVNLSSVNQNIIFIITENGLKGSQANGVNNYSVEDGWGIMSDWIGAGSSVEWTYNHVARRAVDDLYGGISGLITSTVVANNDIPFSITRTAYDNVTNWWNAELVAMIIDNNTHRLVNAVKVPFTVDGSTGINSVTTESGEDISIAVNGGEVNVGAAGDVNVTVYDVNGALAGMADGQGSVSVPVNGKGLYIVKATSGNASVVKKVIIR